MTCKDNSIECINLLNLNDISDCPYYMISRVTLSITSAIKKGFTGAEIESVKPAYLGVLMCLWQEDGLKVVELGQRVILEPSSMTGLIDRMERDGLLYRSPDTDDRRIHRIFLTKQGRKIRTPVLNVLNNTLSDLFSGISAREFNESMHFLRRILANAQDRRKQ
jgi:DNA-binding MarR family transcriptional regulator